VKLTTEQSKLLEGTLKTLKKSYEVDVFRLGERKELAMPVLPTGIFALDHHILGVGGVPTGRIGEIFGVPGGGKTTTMLQLVANTQRRGGLVAYVDAENTLDLTYAKALGVNVDDLLVSQPDTSEQAWEVIIALTATGLFSLVIEDSIAAMVPSAELAGEMTDQTVGLAARVNAKGLRKLSAEARKTNTAVGFVNQLRDAIGGAAFGPKSVTPGGKAFPFYASWRLDVARIGQIKEGTENIGNRTKMTAKKNKCASPFRDSEFDLVFGQGFDNVASLTDMAVLLNVWKKSGASYLFVDTGETITGRNKLRDELRGNTDLYGATFVSTLKALGKDDLYISNATKK
jgi:recombination protein RecA